MRFVWLLFTFSRDLCRIRLFPKDSVAVEKFFDAHKNNHDVLPPSS